jgi:hypothetical protein
MVVLRPDNVDNRRGQTQNHLSSFIFLLLYNAQRLLTLGQTAQNEDTNKCLGIHFRGYCAL